MYTRARIVTHESECRCHYGDTTWHTKFVSGTVVSCEKIGKRFKYVAADWNLLSGAKRITIYIDSTQDADPSVPQDASKSDRYDDQLIF